MILRILAVMGLAACVSFWQPPAFAEGKIELCNATPFTERLALVATRHLVEKDVVFRRYGVHVMPAEQGTRDNYPADAWIVYFPSRSRCGERGLDGGGWTVALDPKTLNILKSYYSDL